ncbi:MAG: threonine synthase [Candidatus Omnitrophica bacterium]|nr:threonine synthase [Candidatus Omnitrophota bacterium]
MKKPKERSIGIIERYQKFLPVTKKTLECIISLNEGNTPLILSEALSKHIGLNVRIYYKFEGLNPTGSFKDRGMTFAVTKAIEEGRKAVMCASTGNTSASAAAYAARAGLKCFVLVPEGNVAKGKLSQAFRHGAQVVMVKGNFDEALELVKEITAKYPIQLVNSLNPYRIEGQKTASFEICDALGDAPDYHVIPVGNAGNITAYWKGYKEYFKAQKSSQLPKMLGFQAAGAAPIVHGHPIKAPETVATAIRIGNPASWKQAEQARDESNGLIDMVTDDEIIAAYRFLAEHDGVFCEPASAASVAGLIKLAQKKYFKEETTIVCTLTGHGLKDPDLALSFDDSIVSAEPKIEEIIKIMDMET